LPLRAVLTAGEQKNLNNDFGPVTLDQFEHATGINRLSVKSDPQRKGHFLRLPNWADSSTEAIRLGALDAIRLIKSKKSIPVLYLAVDRLRPAIGVLEKSEER
jgi:hypothetical protein